VVTCVGEGGLKFVCEQMQCRLSGGLGHSTFIAVRTWYWKLWHGIW